MRIRILFGAFVIVSVLLAYTAPRPVPVAKDMKLAAAFPLLTRALSNISHTLVSDFIWISAAGRGELSGSGTSTGEIRTVAGLIAVMDPAFFPAQHYHATYLASIRGAPLAGAGVYETAARFYPDDFPLIFNEMILRLTYEEPMDEARVVSLAKQAMVLPEKTRYMGTVELSEMVEGMMHYAASRAERSEKKREDLLWLLERSRNPTLREEIKRELGVTE